MSENKYSYPLIPTPHIYWFNGKLVQIWEHRDLHGTLLNQEFREVPNFPKPEPIISDPESPQIIPGQYDAKPIVPHHPSLAFPVDKTIKPLRDSKVPQPVSNPDLKNLLDTMNSILEVAEERGYMDDDAPNYVWETAMEAFYGKEIWNWINKKR